MKPTEQKSLSRDNYARFAQDAIKTYDRKGMVIDAILWSAVIGHYNDDLKRKDDALFAALSVLSMFNTHNAEQAHALVLAALPKP